MSLIVFLLIIFIIKLEIQTVPEATNKPSTYYLKSVWLTNTLNSLIYFIKLKILFHKLETELNLFSFRKINST